MTRMVLGWRMPGIDDVVAAVFAVAAGNADAVNDDVIFYCLRAPSKESPG